jgi:uncharacterized protein (TIGR02118 family)
MEVALFLTCRATPRFPCVSLDTIEPSLVGIPGLLRGVMHEASVASDPYLNDNGSPEQVLQLYFDELAAVDEATRRDSPLARSIEAALGTSAHESSARITQQAMIVRRFSPDAWTETDAGASPGSARCTYLVAYEGAPQDYAAWLGHYLDVHVPLMRQLPRLRELEVYTRLDWVSGLPLPLDDATQRNKVVFDSPAALTDALNSPIRHAMRRDFEVSPPFSGHVTHYPMTSRPVAIPSLQSHPSSQR